MDRRRRKYAEVKISRDLDTSGIFGQPPAKLRSGLFWRSCKKMASRKKSTKHRQKKVNTTFETSSIDSTAVEEKLFGQVEEDEDSDDGPVVFICGKCKLPVGDSVSWDGSEDGQNQIRLKRESEFSAFSLVFFFWFTLVLFSLKSTTHNTLVRICKIQRQDWISQSEMVCN